MIVREQKPSTFQLQVHEEPVEPKQEVGLSEDALGELGNGFDLSTRRKRISCLRGGSTKWLTRVVAIERSGQQHTLWSWDLWRSLVRLER